ncbi:hypothetical protein SDC9_160709 [bioreactor metagenome]|uniref:Uncharacterized protein n=1 Tax=bioreactor metagenome TaxID=1076179 RepID=A0A645FG76_9ZZZZ
MAGDEHRLVAHGPQALRNRVDQLLVVALGEIRAADAASEQHVAHKRPVDLRRVEDHVPGRVAGAVAHVQRLVADLHRVAIVQPARGRERQRGREVEHLALLRQPVDPELVALLGADDRQMQLLRQLARAPRMIDMRMREPQRLQIQTQPLHLAQQHIQIPTWIDDGRILGDIAPDDGRVLLKGRDGDCEVLEHGVMWLSVLGEM